MPERINVEAILKKHNLCNVLKLKQMVAGDSAYDKKTLAAIKEIVELAIDKCRDKAHIEYVPFDNGEDGGTRVGVNRDSIEQVKQLIDYE